MSGKRGRKGGGGLGGWCKRALHKGARAAVHTHHVYQHTRVRVQAREGDCQVLVKLHKLANCAALLQGQRARATAGEKRLTTTPTNANEQHTHSSSERESKHARTKGRSAHGKNCPQRARAVQAPRLPAALPPRCAPLPAPHNPCLRFPQRQRPAGAQIRDQRHGGEHTGCGLIQTPHPL